MENRTPQNIWEAALGELQIQVSKPNYRTWFEKTVGQSYQGNQFIIGVPNAFIAEYLDKNQRSLIEKAIIGLTSPDVRVVFHVNGKRPDSPAYRAELEIPVAVIKPSSQLNPNYIFDSFIEGSGNRLARAAALTTTQCPTSSYNPLFIFGEAGLGKTHLLHAIGHAAVARHMPVICVSAEQFTNEFVNSVREKTTDYFRNKYRNADMLLVDDIQFFSGKEQTGESFFHTFNELHNAGRQIVVTCDHLPKAIPHLEARLCSRFEWGLIVNIKPPDFETRLAILQAKTKQQEVSIPLEVLNFIARQYRQNIRELEGSLNRVIAYTKLLQAPPSVDLAAKALEDIASKAASKASITPKSLMDIVAASFQLAAEDLRGRKKDKETALARRVAMYIIRRETNCSLAQIGMELGGRDAAAVTNACRKTADDITSHPYTRRKLAEIQQKI